MSYGAVQLVRWWHLLQETVAFIQERVQMEKREQDGKKVRQAKLAGTASWVTFSMKWCQVVDLAGWGGPGLSEEDDEYADVDLPPGDAEFGEIELQRWVRGRDTDDWSLERIEIRWWCNKDAFTACRYLWTFSVSVSFRKLAHLF